jgi:hypothetical protein
MRVAESAATDVAWQGDSAKDAEQPSGVERVTIKASSPAAASSVH